MSKEKSEEQTKREEERQQETPDFESRWKRAVADYRNLEKRVAKEREELIKFSNSLLISRLLPVLDDLSEAVEKGGDVGTAQILKKLESVLQEAGLEEIEVEGKEFDPAIMEGVDSGKSAGEKVVAEIVRKGYTLNGKLLRAVRVRVGNYSN